VANNLLDDNAFQVLKSFRPYLGERGNGIMSILENLQELIASEPAQKTLNTFRAMGIGEWFSSQEVKSEAEANPFNLFLILILLLLADGALDPSGAASVREMVHSTVPVQFLP
jgi:hypothetical protein